MATINVYEFKDVPYFSLDIDADEKGFVLIGLLMEEYAKNAKIALESGDFETAKNLCHSANRFKDAIAEAKARLEAKKETEDGETE